MFLSGGVDMVVDMARKPRSVHTCSECGYSSPKWLGRCPDCGSWGTLEESAVAPKSGGGGAAAVAAVSGAVPAGLTPAAPATPITKVSGSAATSVPSGIGELDRVLGSGVVPGSVVLMAGEPGVGKSTLLLEVASRWAALGDRTALYVTAEESAGQVRVRAERTGALKETLYLAAESNLDVVFGHVSQVNPAWRAWPAAWPSPARSPRR